jgi:aspartate beta-hydroxylase
MTTPGSTIDRKRLALDAARAGKLEEAETILRSLLAEDPRDLGVVLLLGDVVFNGGRRTEAGQIYGTALSLSRESPPQAQQAFAQPLARAQERLGQIAGEYSAYIENIVPPGQRSERFDESLGILTGRTPIYLQQPLKYYFPGLPQRAIYPREEFSWAPELEAQTAAIREELVRVMQVEGRFAPYIENAGSGTYQRTHRLVGNPEWSAFYLWKDGEKITANCDLCPVTTAAMEKLPLDFIKGRAPSVLFSLLKPGAHIPPHHGLINTRLICHLPLLVPGPAWLRVGSKRHYWREGELLVFDDSFEHEALNEASETRVVLLFEVWRPELSDAERDQVTRLLASIKLAAESQNGH